MKIDQIENVTLRFEYQNGFQYAGGICNGRLTTLVRVYTDTGQVGIGWAYTLPALMHHIVDNQLAPLEVVDGQITLPAKRVLESS